jgi:hypothetical protein
MSADHLQATKRPDSEREFMRTVLVRVLKTRIDPAEVPTKTCLPEGSKRTEVMAAILEMLKPSDPDLYEPDQGSLPMSVVIKVLFVNLILHFHQFCPASMCISQIY